MVRTRPSRMAISYQIDPATRVIRIVLEGTVTLAEITGFLEQTGADAYFDRRMNRLVLADAVVAFPPDAEIDGIVHRIQDRIRGNDARFAVVAASNAAVVSAFIQHAGGGDRFAVFSREADAWRWLLRADGIRPGGKT
jgi:hypothetical protein